MSVARQPTFLQSLFSAGLLIDTGVDGLYGRNAVFEEVVDRVNALVSRWGEADGAEVLRFPPVVPRSQFEKSGYLKSFPHLAGTIDSFFGTERDHAQLVKQLEAGEDWSEHLRPTRLAMTSAACYSVYPTLAARGALAESGAVVDVCSYCFRHEPSLDPTRMQMFRMREFVRIGAPAQVKEFRAAWLERGRLLAGSLGLPFTVDLANDPFFGRVGKMLAAGQQDGQLKFELAIPITSEAAPTACMSFNYHQDHFGLTWDLRDRAGAVAHTACVAFGLERLALALFRHHGVSPASWPEALRALLWS